MVLFAVAVLAGPPPVSAAPADDTPPPDSPIQRGDVTVDGDSFWAGPAGPRQSRAGTGYVLAAGGLGVNAGYTVRMVTTNPLWTSIDEEVAEAAEAVEWASGSNMTMGAPISSHAENPFEITVEVSNNSPCGPLSPFGAIGCGGGYADFANNIIVGQVFICTCMTSDPTLYGVVLHEMGHAMGLAHYPASWQGQLQVMYPINQSDISYYRSGDVSGLRKLAMNGYGAGHAPTHRPGPTPLPDVGNGGFARLAVTWPAAAGFGLTVDHHEIHVRNTRTGVIKTVTVGGGRDYGVSVTGGDNYQAQVRAHNGKGWGDWSPWSSSTYVTGRCLAGITDVSETSEFCDDITWLLSEDIANGYPNGTFRPTADVARQAMAAFLMRNAERLVPGSTAGNWSSPQTFSDVPHEHPFHDEIEWLVGNDIAGGYANGTFRGDVSLNRQAMAAMLMRFTEDLFPGSTAGDWSAVVFPDVPADHPFHDEITWLASTGITGGFGDGTFRPGADISRQAVAAFLHRHDQEFG